jgi:hypothetical protein
MSSLLARYDFKGTWPGLLLCFIFLLSGVSYGQGPEQKFPDYYPDSFNVIGIIDRIAEDEIVIGDTLYRLSPHATYHTPTVREASKFMFPTGSLVGFITTSKREVISLWLID